MKWFFLLFFCFGGLCMSPFIAKWAKPYLEERLPDEFTLEKIALDIDAELPHFKIPDLTRVQGQSFYYLGHGAQAVAFVSEDGNSVLKFFLLRNMHGKKKYQIPKVTHWIPSHRKARQEKRRKTAFKSLLMALNNYAIAFQKIPEKTGILGLHLLPTVNSLPKISLFDAYGKKHEVDLDRACFVFQEKATLVKEKLQNLSSQEKNETLSKLRDFFAEIANAGFMDREPQFTIDLNYGFLKDQVIQLDVGNIEYLENLKKDPRKEIERMQGLLQEWALVL